MKLLIAAPETLGEIVCSTALLRCIKNEFPEAEIHYWVTPQWAAAVAHQPAITQLHPLAEDPGLLPEISFETVVDLRADRYLRRWTKQRGFAYYGINAFFLVSFLSEHFGLMNAAAGKSIASRYFDAVKALRVHDDGLGARYYIGEKDALVPSDLPVSHSVGYLALVVGDHDYDIAVPENLLALFCKEIAFPVVLVNSRGNNKAAAALATIDAVKIYDACGKFTLNETADILRRALLVISPETGLMQVAAAFDVPLVVLRSSERPSMYYPPCYGRSLQQGSGKRKYAAWVWPNEREMQENRKMQQGKNITAAETWLAEGLSLVKEMLNQRRPNQLQ